MGPGLVPAWARHDHADQVDAYLKAVEKDYSPQHRMLGARFKSPGYHSRVPDGSWVHPTCLSLDYASALLDRGRPGDGDRAAAVIRKVLSLQDTNSQRKTYGIWPWFLEEPLDKMAPPDWNWADFCGARIALMLVADPHGIRPELQQAMKKSLGHAAAAIRKRDVPPSYTNIAIMGGGVCAAAGELLGDDTMLRYGRERLRKTVEHARYNGGFTEYNSPTYTMVALGECERTLQLVHDPQTREAAESLRRIAWEIVADSYHPGTHQWAGPHSRAYGDHISRDVAEYLARQTGADIPPHPSVLAGSRNHSVRLFAELPCPDALTDRFRRLPEPVVELRRTFIRRTPDDASTRGTTWLSGEACLGSVNRSIFWAQRRVLIGYWRTASDPAVVLRLRFFHDGKDFASMAAVTQQHGARALSLFYPVSDRGDWHPSLDRPKDGVFHATDLRVRYELSGNNVQAESLAGDRFALIAEPWRAVIHTIPGRFLGGAVTWKWTREDGHVALDGICYHGPRRAFNFHALKDVVLGAAVELLNVDQPPAKVSPLVTQATPGHVAACWDVGEPFEVSADFPAAGETHR